MSEGRTPTVRVGIVSWNTSALLDGCLAHLPDSLGDVAAEVVVVDNNSSDDSAEVVGRHPGVTLIRNDENVGYARAMNQALAGTEAPYVMALNPDTVPLPGQLGELVRRLDADPGAALVSPRLVGTDGHLQHTAYRFPSLRLAAVVGLLPQRLLRGRLGRRFWLEGAAPHSETADVDWVIGAVHCIRRAALAGDAPYSEKWFMYAEDLELCWRLRSHGWRITFVADLEIVHVGNAAGAQAWGETRMARWTEASYEWYRDEFGGLATRAWALLNTIGVGRQLALIAAARAARRPRQSWTSPAVLRRLLRLHGAHAFGRQPRYSSS